MTIEKQAASIIWTAHDGMFQVTLVVPGNAIITYEMSPETFYRQFGRQAELVASKTSGVGQCPNLNAIRNPG